MVLPGDYRKVLLLASICTGEVPLTRYDAELTPLDEDVDHMAGLDDYAGQLTTLLL